MKTFDALLTSEAGHWVGNGFPVRSLFSYHADAAALSPFLLFDYAGPWTFEPAEEGEQRGVGQHPHRGFETVTIVYDGAVSHRDSAGGGGTIGAGEVQWMTAGAGVIHEEYHAPGFARSGGPFRMVQLWVNLPAADKLTTPRYQAITRDMIPETPFAGGTARIIAGHFDGVAGPAATFTPVNLWDVRLPAGAEALLPVPDGHTTLVAVLAGHATIAGCDIGAGEIARLSRAGEGAPVVTNGDVMLLVMTGEPIDEPVVGHGPFVMNSADEIRQAFADYQAGRFGAVAA